MGPEPVEGPSASSGRIGTGSGRIGTGSGHLWPELADAFRSLDYRVDAVVGLIGAEAHAALGRNSTVPAARALAGRDDPLATLTRLWLLQQPVPAPALERALPGLVAAAGRAPESWPLRQAGADARRWSTSARTPPTTATSGSPPT